MEIYVHMVASLKIFQSVEINIEYPVFGTDVKKKLENWSEKGLLNFSSISALEVSHSLFGENER